MLNRARWPLAVACLLALQPAASADPVLVAFPDGVYVPASELVHPPREEGELLHLSSQDGEWRVDSHGAVEGSACLVRTRRLGTTLFLHRDGLICLNIPVNSGEPELAAFRTQPLLDYGMAPADGRVRVVIDAGHGGKDAGARGISGAVEKEITLAVATRLRDALAAHPGFEVFLTREDDRYLSLKDRAAFANRINADLFVSIHCNSGRRVGARGVELFIAGSRADDAEAHALAEQENAGEQPPVAAVDDVSMLLGDLALADQLRHSAKTADSLLVSLTQGLATESRGVKRAPFWVLLGSNMPAVLIEAGFVTNPEEGRLLADPEYQQRMAASAAHALLGVQEALLSRRKIEDAKTPQTRSAGAASAQADPQLAP